MTTPVHDMLAFSNAICGNERCAHVGPPHPARVQVTASDEFLHFVSSDGVEAGASDATAIDPTRYDACRSRE